MPRYNPAQIEPKWQKFWDDNKTFRTPDLPTGEKLYVLGMFPYPSGDGLHVGHPEGYTANDIVARMARMRGKCVMHPMGFDSFGLPAEEHAIRTNTPPRVSTERNIANFRRQLKMLGFSYDWDRELATTDVGYFRWTQWIFLQIYDTWYDPDQGKGRPIAELPIPAEVRAGGERAVRLYQDEHRLAYQCEAPVNWCPALGTVLANEEVIGGVSERGGHPVTRIPLRQWMLRITAYADRLEKDLDGLDWSESIKTLQRNWIGRSTGAEVDFYIGRATAGTSDPCATAGLSSSGVDETSNAGQNSTAGQASSGTPSSSEFDVWKASRGRSGYPRKPGDDVLRIYTTRPDTLFGATYMVIAPEHPLVARLTTPAQQRAVADYCEKAASKSDLDRTELAKQKSGVFTGSHAINPVNGEAIPIWIADYVLMSYGTGAIMAVPGHDERDFEFAQEYDLRIRCVVLPSRSTGSWPNESPVAGHRWYTDVRDGKKVFTYELDEPDEQDPPIIEDNGHKFQIFGPTTAVNSGEYTGLTTAQFKQKITADLAPAGTGRGAVNYKLRDWLFSRQRFWGEPFPILHEIDAGGKPTGMVRAAPAEQLPLDLPELADFRPHGRPEPPLDKAPLEWLYPVIDGVKYKRETNTMPQWAGSCWYYLRYLDPKNDRRAIDPAIERAWMPVDLYVGGAEHAVLHLLYSRFWHKVLYDRGIVSTPEPFQKLVNQGMILGEVEITGYRDGEGRWVSAADVRFGEDKSPFGKSDGERLEAIRIAAADAEKQADAFVLRLHPTVQLDSRAYKMSKSRGNVVNPDSVVAEYGADALRLYEMFMGPLEATKPWSMDGVSGVRGFLDRAWRMIVDDRAETMRLHAAVADVEPTGEQSRVIHKTIKAVTDDLDRMSFNTAIARMMEFTNYFTRQDRRPRAAMETLVLLLSPLAPHISEELWRTLGHSDTLAYEPWPAYDAALLRDDTVEIPVQVNGKLRGKVVVAADATQEAIETAARSDDKIAAQLSGKQVVKTVVIQGRMVNFVIK